MLSIKKLMLSAGFALLAQQAFAAPVQLTSHNLSDLDSKAFIGGTLASPSTTQAGTTKSTPWNKVKMICSFNGQFSICNADIKLGRNGQFNVLIGRVAINLTTGVITPSHIEGGGYQLDVVGLAETRITKK